MISAGDIELAEIAEILRDTGCARDFGDIDWSSLGAGTYLAVMSVSCHVGQRPQALHLCLFVAFEWVSTAS